MIKKKGNNNRFKGKKETQASGKKEPLEHKNVRTFSHLKSF